MNRRVLALITLPLSIAALGLGFAIFELGWGLAGTLLISYAAITGLTMIAIAIALVISPRGGRPSRPPAVTRSH